MQREPPPDPSLLGSRASERLSKARRAQRVKQQSCIAAVDGIDMPKSRRIGSGLGCRAPPYSCSSPLSRVWLAHTVCTPS